jgi:tetratricopeptide (TPR) repeat protein
VIVHLRDAKALSALIWSLACLISGAVIGFLFGIPRVLQSDAVPGAQPKTEGAGSDSKTDRTPIYQVNTNLEQVSDWLTKIIVGLGLIELRNVPDYLNRASNFIAPGLGGLQYKSFAGGLILYFSLLGFIGFYLITRLFIAGAFRLADTTHGLPLTEQKKDEIINQDLSFRRGGSKLSGEAQEAAREIVQVPLETLTSLTDIIVWAKAQLSAGDYEKAVSGYSKAIQMTPDNVQLRLEYASALYLAKRPSSEREAQLIRAYNMVKVTPEIDPSIKMKVYRALTFHYLYFKPPEGFSNSIKYGEEYVNDPAPRKIQSGGLWVNLAAAYGQKYRWLRDKEPSNEAELAATRARALGAVQQALLIDKHGIWRKRLQTLMQRNVDKASDDDDLEVFEQDQEFRQLLGLPELKDAVF